MTTAESVYEPVKPKFTEYDVVSLCMRIFGMAIADFVELDGYDDQNFWIKKANDIGKNKHLTGISPYGYVLKITNAKDSENISLIEAQIKLLQHLEEHKIPAQRPVRNVNGNYYSLERVDEDGNWTSHAVRMLTYCPGELMLHVEIDHDLCNTLGTFLYELDQCLKTFDHPALHDRDLLFLLTQASKLRNFLHVIDNAERKEMVAQSILKFEQEVMEKIDQLESGIIHGDFNESNVVIRYDKVAGILDFGDSHYGPYIFEVAIGMTYILLLTRDYKLCSKFLNAYTSKRKLTPLEESILTTCVRARICQSLVLGLYAYSRDSTNTYVLTTQKSGWDILKALTSSRDDILLADYDRK